MNIHIYTHLIQFKYKKKEKPKKKLYIKIYKKNIVKRNQIV